MRTGWSAIVEVRLNTGFQRTEQRRDDDRDAVFFSARRYLEADTLLTTERGCSCQCLLDEGV